MPPSSADDREDVQPIEEMWPPTSRRRRTGTSSRCRAIAKIRFAMSCSAAWPWPGWTSIFGDIIVPTEMVSEFKGGKKRVVKRKLYPGYLVVNMEINEDTWFLVRETPGIGDFTGSAGKPTPMSPQEIARIVAKQEEETDEGSQAEDRRQAGRPRQNQRRHFRELRRGRRRGRRGQRPRDGHDQHFWTLDSCRAGVLADRKV